MRLTTAMFRSRRRRVSFAAITLLVCTVVATVPVLAFAPGPGTGNNDPFNATDATPSCNPSPTLNLNNPTSHAANVAVTCTETGGPKPVTVTWVSDTVSGSSTDDAWGQGDKSDCFLSKTGGVAGACVTQVFGIGAAKTDLQYHGIGLAKGTNGHDYLYSGIKRLAAGGITSSNANYNVEVNQLLPAYEPSSSVCPTGTTGGCNIWRSPGDLTLMTDWGGNQSSCNVATPAICAYVWIDFSTGTGKTPSPAGSTCFNAQAAPCWGTLPGGSAALSANVDKAAGSIDNTTFTFSEIGVDLTQSGLVPAGACETFQNVWAHSRSSSSFSAELKDFIFGNVTISTCTGTTTTLHERTDATGAGDVQSGSEITVAPGAFVNDVAAVTGSGVTGSVKFKYYTSATLCGADGDGTSSGTGITTVSTNTLSSGSATSDTKQFSTVGDFYWRAFYSGNLSSSVSPCDEIVHVVQVDTALSTAPWIYPNDKATVTAPNGGGTPTGSVKFRLYDSSANCSASTPSDTVGTGGLLYKESVNLPASSPFTVSTANTSVKVESTAQVYWRVEFTSTNSAQKGRNSLCVENINATLTGDTGGTAP